MRYFLIGLLLLAIIAVVLYFILSRVYDYMAFRGESHDISRQTKREAYDEALKLKSLEAEKKRLTQAIEVRSQHFQSLEEIKQLEKELSEVDDTIRSIKED